MSKENTKIIELRDSLCYAMWRLNQIEYRTKVEQQEKEFYFNWDRFNEARISIDDVIEELDKLLSDDMKVTE